MRKIIISYDDNKSQYGSVKMRGMQLFEVLKDRLHIEIKPISKCLGEHNSLIIIVKPTYYEKYTPLLRNKNIVMFDILDSFQVLDSKLKLMKNFHGAIFCSEYTRHRYANYFAHPELCFTAYHHWDPRFENFNNQSPEFNLAYIGDPTKVYLSGSIPNIDYRYIKVPTDFSIDMYKGINAHFIMKPKAPRHIVEPITKVSAAAATLSPVITLAGPEKELLGDTYPYYVKSNNMNDIKHTIKFMKDTYNHTEWNLALDIMKHVKERTSLMACAERYIDFATHISKTLIK
jgi:hypothetical protein